MLSISLDAIDRQEALRYMGWHGAPDAAMTALLDKCEQQLLAAAQPKAAFRVLPLKQKEGALYADMLPLSGRDIAALLTGCDRVILMAATLSGQTDTLIRRAEAIDMTQALATDALASAGIEQVCNRAEEQSRMQLPDVYFTWRYSPGYGDFPLTVQPQILAILDAARQLGLTVTPESILIPRKSVTALIGLSDRPPGHQARGCTTCRMRKTCAFRKNGTRCNH